MLVEKHSAIDFIQKRLAWQTSDLSVGWQAHQVEAAVLCDPENSQDLQPPTDGRLEEL